MFSTGFLRPMKYEMIKNYSHKDFSISNHKTSELIKLGLTSHFLDMEKQKVCFKFFHLKKKQKIMKAKILLTLSMLACMFLFMQAQNQQMRTVKGKVTDAKTGEAIPFANISTTIDGKVIGTNTDFDGLYSLKIPNTTVTLMFAYVGYQKQEITVKPTENEVNVALTEESELLESVEVVSYSTPKRKPKKSKEKKSMARQTEPSRSNAPTVVLRGPAPRPSPPPSVRPPAPTYSAPPAASGPPPAPTQFHDSAYTLLNAPTDKASKGRTVTKEEIANLPTREVGSIASQAAGINNSVTDYYVDGIKVRNEIEEEEPSNEIVEVPKEILIENHFESIKTDPLSTFSIDVDKAAYTNMRSKINYGQKPRPNDIRIEEMINYFQYDYPQPKSGHPFSVSVEMADCPWQSEHYLALVGLQGKTLTKKDVPAQNLTFLLDVSGSMNSADKLPLLKEGFKLLVNELTEKDRVAIVVYAGAAGAVLPPTSGKNKKEILAVFDNLRAGGSTAGGAGIELAYKLAKDNFIENGNNRVILATDGDFNVGVSSQDGLVKLIEEKRKTGIFLSVLGFGSSNNYQDAKMEELSNYGNGNYAFIEIFRKPKKSW